MKLGFTCLLLVPVLSSGPVRAQSGANADKRQMLWAPSGVADAVHEELRWLRLGGELRTRFEAPTASGLKPGFNDQYLLTRFRLRAGVQVQPWFRIVGEMQDVRGPGYNAPVPATILNRFDLRQAYVEAGDAEGPGFAIRLGRQSLKYGKGRLVADPDWGNEGQTFDAIRATYSAGSVKLDAFAASPVVPQDGLYDRSYKQNMLYGLYGSVSRFGDALRIEPYLLLKSNAKVKNELGKFGALDVYTPGVRLYGLGYGFDWEAEMALQRGTLADHKVSAFGGAYVLGYTTGLRAWQSRVSLTYMYASGDNNPQDRLRNTFDTLYPSTHLRNGATDRIGWANIHDPALQSEWRFRRKWKLTGALHDFYLATLNDALYSKSCSVIVKNAKATSRHVGYEPSLLVDYQLSRETSIGAGFAYLAQGEFLRQSHLGGASQPYLYVDHK